MSTEFGYAQIPLYLVNIGGGTLKLGIYIAFEQNGPFMLYEFDTGASGFYPATAASANLPTLPWWTSYSPTTYATFKQQYSSGNCYTAQSTSATLYFQGSAYDSSNTEVPLPSAQINVGAIVSATNTDANKQQKFEQDWHSAIVTAAKALNGETSGVYAGAGPLQNVFFGDFGVGLGGAANSGQNEGPPVMAAFPQMIAPLCNSITICIDEMPANPPPEGKPQPWGYVYLGNVPADVFDSSKATKAPMVTVTNPETFPNPCNNPNTLHSYAQGAAFGSAAFSNGHNNYSPSDSINLVLDTGAPAVMLHLGSTGQLTSTDLSDYFDISGDKSYPLQSGASMALQFLGNSALNFNTTQTGSPQATALTENTFGKQAGYINTGLGTFFQFQVQFNLATGIIAFLPNTGWQASNKPA